MSALPLKADEAQTCWHVGFVPIRVLTHRSKNRGWGSILPRASISRLSFDHLVGDGKQSRREGEPERVAAAKGRLILCGLASPRMSFRRNGELFGEPGSHFNRGRHRRRTARHIASSWRKRSNDVRLCRSRRRERPHDARVMEKSFIRATSWSSAGTLT